MTVITTRLTVSAEGAISTATRLPAGEHVVRIELAAPPERQLPKEPFDTGALPTLDLGPWPEGVTLRREELYGDDGR